MPSIIDYEIVLAQLRHEKLKCLYHNSGAFGFPADINTCSVGWIGSADPSIRPEAMSLVRQVAPPFEKNLTDLAVRAWREILPGKIWIMPKSHWAYELDFGSTQWMPTLLENIGLDPALLAKRNNAAAIEFNPDEQLPAKIFIERLLQMLQGNDFQWVFPARATLCTIHSHKQLWWTTMDCAVAKQLDGMAEV